MEVEKAEADGSLVIPINAHIRIGRPDFNQGATVLRRPFSYYDGFGRDGAPDAGMLIIRWQADPLRGFVPVQDHLERGDALSQYFRHEASDLFAVTGGAAKGEYVRGCWRGAHRGAHGSGSLALPSTATRAAHTSAYSSRDVSGTRGRRARYTAGFTAWPRFGVRGCSAPVRPISSCPGGSAVSPTAR